MEVRALEKIGLTQGEIKVYLALSKLGESKTGRLVSVAGVSSSKVYKILDRLENKGLVGHVLKGKINYFSALEPRRLLDYVDEQENQLISARKNIEEIIPELNKQRKSAEEKSIGIVCSGFKAVTNAFRNIVDELKPGETYYVIGAGYGSTPGLREFFLSHHARRSKHGVRVKMIANYDVKGNIVETTKQNSEIRYLPQYLITNMQIGFYKNKAVITLWTKEPTAFILESEEAVKSFKAYFDAFWKIAKK